ncbi:hypothetical protein [Halobacteriovorax marinus]|uniref:hypothetical protein n=1 Tax=Halobacteriovorax marinus TaxID=97084 RepID=UPI003A95BFEA
MSKLFELLTEEFYLWETLTASSVESDDYNLIATGPSNDVGFLNIAIKKNSQFKYTSNELKDLQDFFSSKETKGNIVIEYIESRRDDAIENSEYFFKGAIESQNVPSGDIEVLETDDYLMFSECIQNGFEYPEGFASGFAKKMESISSKMECRFFLLKYKGEVACITSFFKTPKNNYYCMMNTSTMHKFRKRGLSEILISYSHSILNGDVFARTNNPHMASLLRKMNYSAGDRFQIVPVDALI